MSAGEGWGDQLARQTDRELHPKLLGTAGAFLPSCVFRLCQFCDVSLDYFSLNILG